MADSPLQDELLQLFESSLSIAALDDASRAALKERLLALPEGEMRKVVDVLKKEQKEQMEAMKNLVSQIEQESANLKKTFLKEREKNAKQDEKEMTDDLLKQIDEDS